MSVVASGDAGLNEDATVEDAAGVLAALRAEIDRLDEALHDQLMARAEVVEQVAARGGKGKAPLRAGREAAILRRLLARHHGGLPARAVVRIWRELLAATSAMQAPIVVAVAEPEPGAGYAELAHEHFGALTPLRAHRGVAQAIGDLAGGKATVAVLPLPVDGEPAPWWPGLMHRAEPRLFVVARLPFWASRPEGASGRQALVLAATAPDASGADRTLIGLEVPPTLSRARLAELVAGAGLADARVLFRRDPHDAFGVALLDVEGFITEADARLAALGGALRPPVVLGAYATPLEGENP